MPKRSWFSSCVPWLCTVIIVVATIEPATAAPKGDASAPVRDWDIDTVLDANQIGMFVTNEGSFAFDAAAGNPGFFYPAGSDRTAIYAAGLWLGATVDGQLRVRVAEYSNQFVPGPILTPTQWGDPADPSYHVYKIARGDTPQSNPDYAHWPVGDGAPVDATGAPRHFGDQTLWSVCNDLNPIAPPNNAGSSEPLGVEVQNTAFALDGSGSQTIVFMQWKIINKGTNVLTDTYVGIWSDPDLGGSADDLIGCDPSRSSGYCYNADNDDTGYGASPPAVGFDLVQGPIVPSPGDVAYVSGRHIANYRNLPMTSFTKYINGTDPDSPFASYNYMRGLNPDGSPIIDPTTGLETTFMVPGDPVSGDGWIDANPSDRRMMISAGPFTMAPGDTQIVAAAVVIGQGRDRLASVTELRNLIPATPDLFHAIMDNDLGACCAADGACSQTTLGDCQGGRFFSGEACYPGPCSELDGACCFDSGVCLLLRPDECAGFYQGDGSVCSPGLCPVYGSPSACCLGASCQVLPEYDCLAQDGRYFAGETCELLPPGGLPGWRHSSDHRLMIDEVAGPGGIEVPPDGLGGPGNNVWRSRNSTDEWLMSAAGGGTEEWFTRGGADLANLGQSDIILRWDERPDNMGWWTFDSGQVGRIPFGLYERDPFTGRETRLIPKLASRGGSEGIYDMSWDTPDIYGWPATDWVCAFRFDPAIATYEEFVEDAQDGHIDRDPTTAELFARMILVSNLATLPADGTVIQFVTNKSGILAGSGFAHAVPLSWPAVSAAVCGGERQYAVFRDSVLVGITARTDFLDSTDLIAGRTYVYQIRTREPITGEESEPSSQALTIPSEEGHAARSGRSGISATPPRIDGVLNAREWALATRVDATYGGVPATISVMNDARFLYIGLEDSMSADDFRIYVDANGNGVFDLDALEGVISFSHGVRHFTRLQGSYPDVHVVQEVANPKWMSAAVGERTAEIRLMLQAGPLEGRPASDVAALFFQSVDGSAVYPQGPPAVLTQAPALFARIQLIGAPPPNAPDGMTAESDEVLLPAADASETGTPTLLAFPNPFHTTTTITYGVPRTQRTALALFAVNGELIRRLVPDETVGTGLHDLVWDGTDASGRTMPSGVYYLRIEGESFRIDRTITLLR